MPALHGVNEFRVARDGDVEVLRVDDNVLDRTLRPGDIAANDPDFNPG